jgi:hypothetical protein
MIGHHYVTSIGWTCASNSLPSCATVRTATALSISFTSTQVSGPDLGTQRWCLDPSVLLDRSSNVRHRVLDEAIHL